MKHLHIHIGGGFDATERRVLDVVARLDRGEAVEPEEHLTFETWEVFFRTMTANRVAILRHVAVHRPRSIRALAEALGRDYANVHDDVAALKRAGLLRTTKAGITTDCDVDHATIDDDLVARAVGAP